MNEKRFKSTLDEETMDIMPYLVSDNQKEMFYNLQGCIDLLNKLYEENKQLRKENIFLAKQRNYWKSKCDVAVETFETDEATAKKIMELEEENERLRKENVFLAYWKRKAMTLLMQVRRLTPRMTDEEVMEFSKELEDE